MANNKIREILTDEVLEEILCRFYETSGHPDDFKKMISEIDVAGEIHTWEDKEVFLEAIRKINTKIVAPWQHILTHYLQVKERGLQIADKTGFYICTSCRKKVFKRVGQKITPCECFAFGSWYFCWDTEHYKKADKAKL